MTKAEIRSLVKNLLPKEDNTGKYHSGVIDAAIETVMNQIFYDVFARTPLDLDNYTRELGGAGTPIAVSLNSNTGVYYSTIPYNYVPLPDKASGIRRVYQIADGAVAFYPMSRREVDHARGGSYFSQASDKIGYIVRGSTIEYYKMDSTTASAGVRMDILMSFRSYLDTDKVLFPLGRENDVIKGALEMMGVIPPKDLSDDNNDIIPRNNG